MLKHVEHTQQGLLKDKQMPSSSDFIHYNTAVLRHSFIFSNLYNLFFIYVNKFS